MTRVARMDAAYLTNFALADPEKLAEARDNLELELAMAPGDAPREAGGDAAAPDVDAIRTACAAMFGSVASEVRGAFPDLAASYPA